MYAFAHPPNRRSRDDRKGPFVPDGDVNRECIDPIIFRARDEKEPWPF